MKNYIMDTLNSTIILILRMIFVVCYQHRNLVEVFMTSWEWRKLETTLYTGTSPVQTYEFAMSHIKTILRNVTSQIKKQSLQY